MGEGIAFRGWGSLSHGKTGFQIIIIFFWGGGGMGCNTSVLGSFPSIGGGGGGGGGLLCSGGIWH